MKTLVFCTTFAEHRAVWDMRHAWWIKALQASELRYDQLLLVDDASPELPDWPHVRIVHEAAAATPLALRSRDPVVLYTHGERLGRTSVFEFPGWHRSFAFGAQYAHVHGFDKVIHLESDAFLVSQRIQQHFNDVSQGWAAVWSSRYTFPEIALQIAAGRDVARMAGFFERPYAEMAGAVHESALPYTHIEKRFVGDRYGEFMDSVPGGIDYVAQGRINQPRSYYWWFGDPKPRARSGLGQTPPPVEAIELQPPFGVDIGDGDWSGPEPGARWMTGWDSSLTLPPVKVPGDHLLELEVAPARSARPDAGQRLYVLVNEALCAEVLVLRRVVLQQRIPASRLRRDGTNRIKFLHPDGNAPSNLTPPVQDDRELSLALLRTRLTPAPSTMAAEPEPGRLRSLFKR